MSVNDDLYMFNHDLIREDDPALDRTLDYQFKEDGTETHLLETMGGQSALLATNGNVDQAMDLMAEAAANSSRGNGNFATTINEDENNENGNDDDSSTDPDTTIETETETETVDENDDDEDQENFSTETVDNEQANANGVTLTTETQSNLENGQNGEKVNDPSIQANIDELPGSAEVLVNEGENEKGGVGLEGMVNESIDTTATEKVAPQPPASITENRTREDMTLDFVRNFRGDYGA